MQLQSKLEKDHIENFLNAIRGEAKLRSEIAEGHHLANIAYRTVHTIQFDPVARKILGDREAQKLWGREYRRGWTPKV